MKQTINWTNFEDEIPTESGYYLVKLNDTDIPIMGFIQKEDNHYICDYARKNPYTVQYDSCRIHFDKKCLGRLVAWTSAKEIYNG